MNPNEVGNDIFGLCFHADLKSIDEPIDMVDVFRSSDAIMGIAQEAIEIGARVLWTQLEIINEEAASLAEKAGLKVVMNRCPKIEFGRLYGELSWSGVNSRIISAKRPRLKRSS